MHPCSLFYTLRSAISTIAAALEKRVCGRSGHSHPLFCGTSSALTQTRICSVASSAICLRSGSSLTFPELDSPAPPAFLRLVSASFLQLLLKPFCRQLARPARTRAPGSLRIDNGNAVCGPPYIHRVCRS